MSVSQLLDAGLGIQSVLDAPLTEMLPEARPLASNAARSAGLEQLYAPANVRSMVEDMLRPAVADGDPVRPAVFTRQLRACTEKLEASALPAARELAAEELRPLLDNERLLRTYAGLLIGG